MKNFFLVVTGVFFGIFLWNLAEYFSPVSIISNHVPLGDNSKQFSINYVDLVSLMLTSVTIVLAALGFVVAILAFVGWNSIRAIAESSAKSVVKNSISDGGVLHGVVRKEVRDIIRYTGMESVDTEYTDTETSGEEENGE